MATHSGILAWTISIDRGAWWATVLVVAKSWTWLRDYAQICRWHHSNGRKRRGTKEPLDEGEKRLKEESGKAGLKHNIQKTKIVASGPITSWQIDGEKVETMADFIFLCSKITADGDWEPEEPTVSICGCWVRLLRVLWTARKSNQSILKEINSEINKTMQMTTPS